MKNNFPENLDFQAILNSTIILFVSFFLYLIIVYRYFLYIYRTNVRINIDDHLN